MKPDACIDLLKCFQDKGVQTVMRTVKRHLDGLEIPAYIIDAGVGNNSICHYEFIGDILSITDEVDMRIFTRVDDVKFITKEHDDNIYALINREFARNDFVMYNEVIYGRRKEGEYNVRTV